MKNYVFRLESTEDEAIVKTLDGLNAEEREEFIRKALLAYIRQNPPAQSKKRTSSPAVRPEPHGYPVE